MVNLKELAARLNLSVSTVSKALNDSYEINQHTKQRVLELARALNYEPNPYARGLRSQKTRTIAVIIPEIANNFFTLAINGIESVARELDYHVLIYLTHEDVNKEIEFTRLLQNGRVDGVLISVSSNSSNDDHLQSLHAQSIPLVFFDRVFEDFEAAKVTTDDYESSYNGTLHLIEQGCRQIAHLGVPGLLSIGRKRKTGYLDALRKHGLPVREEFIIEGTNDHEYNSRLIRVMLERPDRPDGIFTAVEKLAINSYQVCNDLDIKIGEAIKIISFSNLEIAALLSPSLTTITQPAFDIGKEAASLLFKAIRKKNISDNNVVLKSVLMKRNSTGIWQP